MRLDAPTERDRPGEKPLVWILLTILWLAAVIAIPARNRLEEPAWDTAIYLQGVDSVRAGHDPYADAIARQQAFHEASERGNSGPTPFSYVYAPITLPLLRLVTILPLWLSSGVYFSLYVLGALAQLWVGFSLAAESERPFFRFVLPIALFLPGLLASDILWSGNVAFLLYGAALAAAYRGWKSNRWAIFYVVVIVACCFKGPLLTLLAIPVLSAKKQWLPTGFAAIFSLAVYAAQALFAPALFRHYVQAVNLQFVYNRDFGSSPAGLVGGLLFDHKLPYIPAVYFAYLAYAIPVCFVLYLLSKRFLDGRVTGQQWFPVLLVGVILLNPRILEYDENFLMIPMALLVWRFFRAFVSTRVAVALALTSVFALNLLAYRNWNLWKLTEGPLLLATFFAGSWTLYRFTNVHKRFLNPSRPGQQYTLIGDAPTAEQAVVHSA